MEMVPNGYIKLDMGGINLGSASSQSITGLYARITAAVAPGKPVLLCNMNGGASIPATPCFGTVYAASTSANANWVIICGTKTITVTSASAATVVTAEKNAG